ncbi:alpha/beta hydrolase-fold protein [Lignipirellula cremea]|uniref:Esterase n=1 Tax=Lignipirellula cremea TaxID=2528010 RepID=A0A518DVV9_9BACT|nr:alpha/beta hydrolase-fold protein [Lignipirellula cremea]QDU95972.1 Putative esterase [Lignipirellula cremea]
MNRTGKWTVEKIAGHDCDIYEPSVRNPQGYVVLYLHGVHLQSLTDKTAFIEQFEKHGLPCIAPHTQRSWWTDIQLDEFDPQLTAEQHILKNVLPFIRERMGADSSKLALLGTSMGGQGALRLAYKHPQLFPVTAAISPAVDYYKRFYDPDDETISQMYDDPEAARQDSATLHIHPLNWPRHQFFCCCLTDDRWWDSVDRLRMKLYSLGIPHTCELETAGGGHSFEYYSLMAPRAIDFIVTSLKNERLRIIT